MPKTGIYVCSKLSHAPFIKKLRAEGYPITSSWIDHAHIPEAELNQAELWDKTLKTDLKSSTHIVAYVPEMTTLKGAIGEMFALWILDKPVHIVSPLTLEELRTICGTFVHSSLVTHWPHLNIRSVLDIITHPVPKPTFVIKQPSRP